MCPHVDDHTVLETGTLPPMLCRTEIVSLVSIAVLMFINVPSPLNT